MAYLVAARPHVLQAELEKVVWIRVAERRAAKAVQIGVEQQAHLRRAQRSEPAGVVLIGVLARLARLRQRDQ